MKRVRAYTFKSPMTLGDMFARLNEIGPWRWIERDSDRFGEYISARAIPEPDHGMVKIFVEPGRYAVDLLLEADPSKLDAVNDTLFTHLLPAVGATEISETDHYE